MDHVEACGAGRFHQVCHQDKAGIFGEVVGRRMGMPERSRPLIATDDNARVERAPFMPGTGHILRFRDSTDGWIGRHGRVSGF
jgi:hypothetical protein